MVTVMMTGLLSLFGCAFAKKYKLNLSPDAESDRTSYREGEEVTVRVHNVMDEIITVYVDGVEMTASNESNDDYTVIKFIMPAHDVTVTSSGRNISVVPSGQQRPADYTVLVSYFRRTTGTEMFIEYHEFRLCRTGGGSLVLLDLLHLENGTEITAYSAPEEAEQEVYGVIYGAGMETWHELLTEDPMDGGYLQCRFLHEGSYIKVSTEDPMPPDGLAALRTVGSVLVKYIDEDKVITLPDSD